jgi:hypothetical protein
VYSPSDLASLIAELRADFGFPQSVSVAKFQRSLIENGIVQEILFTATYPFESKRYHEKILQYGVSPDLPKIHALFRLE